MTPITLKLRQAIAAKCHQSMPQEACGFVVNGEVVPCANIHPDPENNFAIDARDYAVAEAKGNIEAVYHSHTYGVEGFSVPDVKSCKQGDIPWIVYCTKSGNFYHADPSGNAPYIGRQWIYGIYDCYSLLRDFYRREFGIALDDFERGVSGEWQSSDWNMFMSNYQRQGFYEIDKPFCKGDFVLMQIGAPFPNHAGVINGNAGCFYHHLTDRLSQESVYGGYWAKVTAKVLRHKDL